MSKSLIFLVKSFLGNFYRHWATFYWSHWFPLIFLDLKLCLARDNETPCRRRRRQLNIILSASSERNVDNANKRFRLIKAWSSLIVGDEQLDWPNSQTTMELCHACVGSFLGV